MDRQKCTIDWCGANLFQSFCEYEEIVLETLKMISETDDPEDIGRHYIFLSWLTLRKLAEQQFRNEDIEIDVEGIRKGEQYLINAYEYGECDDMIFIKYCYDFVKEDRSKNSIIEYFDGCSDISPLDDAPLDLVVLTLSEIRDLSHCVVLNYAWGYLMHKDCLTIEGIQDYMCFCERFSWAKDSWRCDYSEIWFKWMEIVACAFINGVGVEQNSDEGVRLLNTLFDSEEEGDVWYESSQTPLLLALVYHYGLNGEVDTKEAQHWYKEAMGAYEFDPTMLGFIQSQMSKLLNPQPISEGMQAKLNRMDWLKEPIRDTKVYVEISLLSGGVKTGDKVLINDGVNTYAAVIKAIYLMGLLVDYCDTTTFSPCICIQGVTSSDDQSLYGIAEKEMEDEEFEGFSIKPMK